MQYQGAPSHTAQSLQHADAQRRRFHKKDMVDFQAASRAAEKLYFVMLLTYGRLW